MWIVDTNDSPPTALPYFPIVNGSETDFTRPFVMTITGNPAHQAFMPIIMRHLEGGANNVPANQLWNAAHGPVS